MNASVPRRKLNLTSKIELLEQELALKLQQLQVLVDENKELRLLDRVLSQHLAIRQAYSAFFEQDQLGVDGSAGSNGGPAACSSRTTCSRCGDAVDAGSIDAAACGRAGSCSAGGAHNGGPPPPQRGEAPVRVQAALPGLVAGAGAGLDAAGLARACTHEAAPPSALPWWFQYDREVAALVRSLGVRQYRSLYDQLMTCFGLLLHKCRDGVSDAASARHAELILCAQRQLLASVEGHLHQWWHAIMLEAHVLFRALGGDEEAEDPGPSYWSRVLDAAQLTADQVDTLTVNARIQQSRLQQLHQHHREVLSDANPSTLASSLHLLRQAAAHLRQFSLIIAVHDATVYTLLDPVQLAAACVAAWPLAPNYVALQALLEERCAGQQQQRRPPAPPLQQQQQQRRAQQ